MVTHMIKFVFYNFEEESPFRWEKLLNSEFRQTAGVDMYKICLEARKDLQIRVWDVNPTEFFCKLHELYAQDTSGFIIYCNFQREGDTALVEEYIQEIREKHPEIPILIVFKRKYAKSIKISGDLPLNIKYCAIDAIPAKSLEEELVVIAEATIASPIYYIGKILYFDLEKDNPLRGEKNMEQDYKSTPVGVRLSLIKVKAPTEMHFQIYDVNLEKEFESLLKLYATGSRAFIIYCNFQRKGDVSRVNGYIREVLDICPDIPVLVFYLQQKAKFLGVPEQKPPNVKYYAIADNPAAEIKAELRKLADTFWANLKQKAAPNQKQA